MAGAPATVTVPLTATVPVAVVLARDTFPETGPADAVAATRT